MYSSDQHQANSRRNLQKQRSGKREREREKNLKPNNKLFLFINIKIIQFFQLFIENPDEPILKVSQRTSTSLTAATHGFQGSNSGGIVKRNRLLKGRKKKIQRMIDGYWKYGRREIRVVFEELFERLVTQKFVSPLRERLFQMGFEFFPKFHSRKLEDWS